MFHPTGVEKNEESLDGICKKTGVLPSQGYVHSAQRLTLSDWENFPDLPKQNIRYKWPAFFPGGQDSFIQPVSAESYKLNPK